jgi:hypothetical protein
MEKEPKTYQPKAPPWFLFAVIVVAGDIIGGRHRLLGNSDPPVDSGAWVEDFEA